eukprot:COSAG01_NODE_7341_length_3242_cov_64.478300_3_plen_112_part_00
MCTAAAAAHHLDACGCGAATQPTPSLRDRNRCRPASKLRPVPPHHHHRPSSATVCDAALLGGGGNVSGGGGAAAAAAPHRLRRRLRGTVGVGASPARFIARKWGGGGEAEL